MKTLLKTFSIALLSLVLTGPVAHAQERPAYTQAELDQMLAPIALYPDPLLSQILMAATYPAEVVQAARWSRANSPLEGEEAVRAVEPMDWDPSVKSLVAFPRILDRMDDQLAWTERLGEAFIAQEPQVMDTIQDLRRRADAAGNLFPDEGTRIVRDGSYIAIEPVRPNIVYVPYYDPFIVYGTWWWPAYRPVYWAPWPGYHVRTTHVTRIIWGNAIVFRSGFFFGQFIWPSRYVVITTPKRANVIVHRQVGVIHSAPAPRSKPVRWKHDPRRRTASIVHAARKPVQPADRAKNDRVLHLDGFGHVLNQPRKASPGPSQYTKSQPVQPDHIGPDSSVKPKRPTPAAPVRSASGRGDAGRPTATARIGVTASQALDSRNRTSRAVQNSASSTQKQERASAANRNGNAATSRSQAASASARFGTHPGVRASSSRPAVGPSIPMIAQPSGVGLR